MRQEAEHAESVVQRHDHDAFARGEDRAVDARADRVGECGGAVHPDHHGPTALGARDLGVFARRPDVEGQALLAAQHGGTRALRVARQTRRLRADGSALEGIECLDPGLGGLRRLPAQAAHWRARVGDAEPGVDAVLVGRADHRPRVRQALGGDVGDGPVDRGGVDGGHGRSALRDDRRHPCGQKGRDEGCEQNRTVRHV